jgi:alkylated DNA repair dioxygenase AlkB
MAQSQLDLFKPRPVLPEGFRYEPEFLSADEERDLAARFAELAFKPFEFHGYFGKRRVVSFGWRYDFGTEALARADQIPAFLHPVRDRAAKFAGVMPADLEHALVTEYAGGAEIGWHKDRFVFGRVVGVSLLSACKLRFRRKRDARWERASAIVEPRSAYLLEGPSRTEWEHSIPAIDGLRYSITFREFRPDASSGDG